MLLITFHGGASPGINNVYGYDTTTRELLSHHALRQIESSKLSELRALVFQNGYLYVANGAKGISSVLTFQHQRGEKSDHFAYVAEFIGPTLSSKGHFKTSIAHPFSLAFDDAGFAYLSNQDTNVVARITVNANFQTGTLPSGCQSAYLKSQGDNFTCPSGDCTFLDGTFVASQVGQLDPVKGVAPNVPAQYGGLAVSAPTGKIQNSVRAVAVANGMLFVCDEPDRVVRIYALPDGTYLGASDVLPDKPTHLALQNGGLYVSAGGVLYWSPLPASSPSPVLKFQAVLTAPGTTKIGGISFNQSGASATVYVCYQLGTGAAVGGSIQTFTFAQVNSGTAPTFSNENVFASGFPDTPEFVLYLPDSLT